ncbi:MAG: hypothetical protein ABIF08_01445 [Nanoarchaeota archaeon]
MLFWRRFKSNVSCRWTEAWTFKVDVFLNIVNTVLAVFMWYFMSIMIHPAILGYVNVGYLPFIMVGSVALFFASRVTASFSGSFYRDIESGIFKLVYLSDMNLIHYFFMNFFTGLIFDSFLILVPMISAYFFLIQIVAYETTTFFSMGILLTILASFAIFVVGQLGFTMMTVGSKLYLKKGDPISFTIEKLNQFFSGQVFPLRLLPAFLAFLPTVLPAAYVILIWRDSLFLGKTIFDGTMTNIMIGGIVVSAVIFAVGLLFFYKGIERAKVEGRWL